MTRIHLAGLLLLFPVWALLGQSAIQKAVDRFVSDAQFTSASLSVTVQEVESGKTIAAHRPQVSLIPASTLKAVTTAAALATLGGDYQFSTDLEYDGHLDAEGVLRGNIYIKGGGDPTLGSHHFKLAEDRETVLRKWVEAVKTKGITRIEGQIIGDATCFDSAPLVANWPWEDIGNYYGSGAWGLNFQENLYFLHLQQKGQLGARPEILQIEPEIPNLLLINELASAAKGTGDNAYIFGGPYAYTRFVRGTIPVGSGRFKVKGSIPDPPFFAAHQFLLALNKAGIECRGSATSQYELDRTGASASFPAFGRDTAQRISFYHYYSPRLRDIAKEANFKSVNIYCEALLKAMGKEKKGEGSTAAGVEVVQEFLVANGIDSNGFFMMDGSGLSPRNAISSGQLAGILKKINQDKKLFTEFYATLPIGGRSGTLRYLFKGTIAEGRIHGKSGGMGRVRSYTGYARTVSGKLLAFAIIANNYTGKSGSIRKKMERLMIEFCRD